MAKDKTGKKARKVAKIKRSKYKCTTTGKFECDQCGKPINRGKTIRMVNVKFTDGKSKKYTFCSKECRNEYCDSRGFPMD